jgi:hypothetical protein
MPSLPRAGGRSQYSSTVMPGLVREPELIRRLAAENRLWGAPRIHGELLKLRIAVSERTVSRYLPDRLTAPSQTWRTFLANHLGDLAFISPVMSSYALGDDDVVDATGSSFRPALLSRDGPCASNQCVVVDSLRRTSLGLRVSQDYLHDHTGTRKSSGRDPPTHGQLQLAQRRTGGDSFRPCLHRASTANKRCETIRSPAAGSPSAVLSLSLCNRVVNVVGRPKRLRSDREVHVCVVIRTAVGILATHTIGDGGALPRQTRSRRSERPEGVS